MRSALSSAFQILSPVLQVLPFPQSGRFSKHLPNWSFTFYCILLVMYPKHLHLMIWWGSHVARDIGTSTVQVVQLLILVPFVCSDVSLHLSTEIWESTATERYPTQILHRNSHFVWNSEILTLEKRKITRKFQLAKKVDMFPQIDKPSFKYLLNNVLLYLFSISIPKPQF